MDKRISLVKDKVSLTPFEFYTSFLKKASDFYKNRVDKSEEIQITLSLDPESLTSLNKYYIDPISLPLLFSFGEQLKRYHGHEIQLLLQNNPGTNRILEFLYLSDFFKVAGISGYSVFEFDDRYIGWFEGRLQRPDHKIRGYSLRDRDVNEQLTRFKNEEDLRDFLVGHYTTISEIHFKELLNDSSVSKKSIPLYVEILSELIANGVLHSANIFNDNGIINLEKALNESQNVYALMFLDRFKTKFSISDNGIGFHESILLKDDNSLPKYYRKFQLFNELSDCFNINVSKEIKKSFLGIFEMLYLSILKGRRGIIDLMLKSVVEEKGYFRVHNLYTQVIVTNRSMNILKQLLELRQQIMNLNYENEFGKLDKDKFSNKMESFSKESRKLLKDLFLNINRNYTEDIKFSSVRFFDIRFDGVHLEVEIPRETGI